MTPAEIARVTHEANRALQLIQADPTIPVSPSWDDSSEMQQASVIAGVEGILAGASPEESHASWVEFKRNDGWVLGPVKDEATKTHPLLVPYAELPPEQQVKDHLFAAIIHALGGSNTDAVHSDGQGVTTDEHLAVAKAHAEARFETPAEDLSAAPLTQLYGEIHRRIDEQPATPEHPEREGQARMALMALSHHLADPAGRDAPVAGVVVEKPTLASEVEAGLHDQPHP